MKLFAILFASLLALVSCGTRKHVTKSNTEVTQIATTSAKSLHKTTSETLYFGDSLTAMGYMPAPALTYPVNAQLPEKSEKLRGESGGIKYDLELKPRRDANGQLTGHDFNFKVTAKPVAKKSESNEQEANARSDTENKGTLVSDDENTKTSWQLPWQFYLSILIAALIGLAIFYKRIINSFKNWKQKPPASNF